ncbi:MAG: FtsH protease activity modulator HflK [Deltaproteobacteria bacterium]|jgi:membrane protease subunit HflK|nr:FtsH protease activity modulator HflK [Deltaproteobacteria bacterium]
MARDEEDPSVDAKVKRSVRRLLTSILLVLVIAAGGAVWAYSGFPGAEHLGFYQLKPGQAAIVLRLGAYARTETKQGLNWHLPVPFERHEIINVSEIMRLEFGVRGGDAEAVDRAKHESSMQTGDNNIVDLGFVLQYRVSDAYQSRYGVAEIVATLRDAAQAAVREVVGTMTVDGAITNRGEVQIKSERLLQDIVDFYAMGIEVMEIELQQAQPPAEVRAAFDDVVAAAQDANLIINQAKAYENEVLPRARAEAIELTESARAYRDAKIAESKGEAERFTALLAAYRSAPEVTRKRLYLETMEAVLPNVEKVIVEPGAASILPHLSLGNAERSQP